MSINCLRILGRRVLVLTVALALTACSSSPNPNGGAQSGGGGGIAANAGGAISTGGISASPGGATGSGGISASSGGATSSGGIAASSGGATVGGATSSVGGGAGGFPVGGGTSSAVASIVGQVVDIAGAPIAYVEVTGGGATAISAADGSFSLSAVPGDVVVSFVVTGYVHSQKRVTASADGSSHVFVTLATQTLPVTINADQGGTVSGPRGSSLTAPAGAFVDAATGAQVSGPITISLTPLDPSIPGEFAAYPGTLIAEATDGSHVLLQTTGVVDVDAEQNGHKLTVKPGVALTLLIPGRASGPNPQTSGLWSFDESNAVWKEEGSTTYDAATNTYPVTLTHLCGFNVDNGTPPGCVKGRIVDCSSKPAMGVLVQATTSQTSATDTTDLWGRYSVAGQGGAELTLWLYSGNLLRTGHVTVTNGSVVPADVFYIDKDDKACTPLPDIEFGDSCKTVLDTQSDAGTPASPQTQCFSGADAGSANPWQGSCASGLSAVFDCYQLSHACVTKMSGTTGFETEYDNGSKTVWTITGTIAIGVMYGPNGQLCGQMESNGDSSFSIGAPSGDLWIFTNKGQTLKCPDGTTETLSADQQGAFTSCSSSVGANGASSDAGSSTQCQMLLPGSCSTPSDCTDVSAPSCCLTRGGSMCVNNAATCLQMQTLACASDGDCTGAMPKCCQSGLIKMCMPACPSAG